MAEPTQPQSIKLEEEYEGNVVGSDVVFQKIGASVPLSPAASPFDLRHPPKQALAVSDRFRLLFIAHPLGFYVVKTKDAIGLAKEIKSECKGSSSIENLCVGDVRIGSVSILGLSSDSSTLAACVGGDAHFFSVPSLLNKEKEPSFSLSLGESGHVKDLRWRKNENSYVILSSCRKLYHGLFKGRLMDVMDNVDAVDYCPNGDSIVVARESSLIILSSDFEEQFNMLFLFQPWVDDTGYISKVDSIRWVRFDSIIVGCIQVTDDSGEEGYLVQVITNKKDEVFEASSTPKVVSFGELFESLDDELVPCGCGPYLLESYLERWELVLASNRKSTDKHVVSLGWSLDDKNRGVVAVEFRHESYLPWIELPENGDDNAIVGFGVDKVSLYDKVVYKMDTEVKEINPYCIMLCITSEGKLVMFHVARISDPCDLPPVHADVPSPEGISSAVGSHVPTKEKSNTEGIVSDDKSRLVGNETCDRKMDSDIVKGRDSHDISLTESSGPHSIVGQTSGIEMSKGPIDFGTPLKADVNSEGIDFTRGLVVSYSDAKLVLTREQSSKSEQLPVKLPSAQGFGPAFSDVTETESLKLTSSPRAVTVGARSTVRSSPSDASGTKQQNFKNSLREQQGYQDSQKVSELSKGFTEVIRSSNSQHVLSGSPLFFPTDYSVRPTSFASSEFSYGTGHENAGIVTGKMPGGKLSFSNDYSVRATSFASRGSSHSTGHENDGIVTGKMHGRNLSASNEFSVRVTSFASSGSGHSTGHENEVTVAGKTSVLSSQISPSTSQPTSRTFNLKDSRSSPSSSVFSYGKPTHKEGPRTPITGTKTPDFVSSFSTPNLSQQSSMVGKSQITSGNQLLDSSRTHSPSGTSRSEVQISRNFCNVNEMVKELDSLLLDIEGDSGFRDACTVFQRSSVLELETGLEKLSERCRLWKIKMEERLGDVRRLLDKTTQVVARRSYLEGLTKQTTNSQYWELWNRQKLSPEFEVKRRHIEKLNQDLVNQIIELERHFNALEINKFGDQGRVPMGHRAYHRRAELSRKTQSLHSLYNTMSSQLVAAEQLSECLSKQMALLNIESTCVKRQNVAKELLESIGLAYDGEVKTSDHTPDSLKKHPVSSFSVIKEHTRKDASSSIKGIEPETARRRRDSLDRSLAEFEPPKTTIKRMLLEECSRVSASKSPLRIGKDNISSELGERLSVARQMHDTESSFSSLLPTKSKDQSSTYTSNKDVQGKSSTQASISPPVSLFKWAKDKAGAPQPVGLASPSMQQKVNIIPPSSTTGASPTFSLIENKTEENVDSLESSSTVANHVSQKITTTVQNVSPFGAGIKIHTETQSNQTSLQISSTTLPTKPASPRKTVNMKSQASESTNIMGGVQTKQSAGSTSTVVTSMASSFSIPKIAHTSPFAFQMDTPNRVESGGVTSSTILSSPLSLAPVSSLSASSSSLSISASNKFSMPSISASAASASSESSPLSVPFGGSFPSKGVEKIAPTESLQLVSTSSLSSASISSDMQKQQISPSSPSPSEGVLSHSPLQQPEVILDKPSAKSDSAQSPLPTTKNTAFSNIFGAASNGSLNTPPQASSATPVLLPASAASTSQIKIEALDATVVEEDEMEEEAPDTTLSLGSLGAFGLGSTPSSSERKPNPFGASFGAATATPGSSPFSMSVPFGQLFRPASFSFSSAGSAQPSQPTSPGVFSSFGSGPSLATPAGSGFGRPAQIGAGQQALGSVLGAFGQSRQLGPSIPGSGFASSSGFGGGGFLAAAPSGVFGPGAGFAGSPSSSSGFANVASAGGGFAAAATSAGAGFASAATGAPTGGFGGFSNRQTTGGFSSFGGSTNVGTGKPAELFTQMRK